jgi:hypothetical protein
MIWARFFVGLCLNASVAIFRFLGASYLTPRARLDQIWRVFSQYAWIMPLIIIMRMVFFESAIMRNQMWYHHAWEAGFAAFLLALGVICGRPHFRENAQSYIARFGETQLVAAAVAAAIGDKPIEEVTSIAAERLRSVRLDKITKEIMMGSALSKLDNSESVHMSRLYQLSEPATFGEIDAFISHSWHEDGAKKWIALQEWREEFKSTHNREPWVWFDVCCLDQLNIDECLMCLPVHLAASRQILVLAGPKYSGRMWCIVELFVFMMAVRDHSRIEFVLLSAEPAQIEEIKKTFYDFSVKECQCYGDHRDPLLNIIEAGSGTLANFDKLLRTTFVRAMS